MQVTLLDHTSDPVARIGQMAGICYDSKTDRDSNIRRAAQCKDRGHLATLRFAYASFNISGISRVCSHQLVRMAHAGILQRSQRYVKESHVRYVNPPALNDMPADLILHWHDIQRKAAAVYQLAIKHKMKKEDARYILPQSCETELNLCLNFQGWRDMLRNRTDKAAQWEVRVAAVAIQQQLHEIAPELFLM